VQQAIKVCDEQPAPRIEEHRSDLPERLLDLIHRCLEKTRHTGVFHFEGRVLPRVAERRLRRANGVASSDPPHPRDDEVTSCSPGGSITTALFAHGHSSF
jgi:hypothetical protein